MMCFKKAKNLWILTEEHPKNEVIEQILREFARGDKCSAVVDHRIRVLPILEDGKFSFTYKVTGFNCSRIKHIYIKTVSGYSSFVDFLLFYQDEEPNPEADTPIYAIEETKTDDSESRNTGAYQRCSKFIYIDKYYPKIRKIMLYDLKVAQKKTPTATNIFGTKLLMTLGVKILGRELDENSFRPFSSVDEVIQEKNAMKPPRNGVPIRLIKENDRIYISGKLLKNDKLDSDPTIGTLSAISGALRRLGWKGRIIITKHGLKQRHLKPGNKFIQIANMLDLELDGLEIPQAKDHQRYWHYEKAGEKLGTIFIHVAVENFADGDGYSIYENHAGCERGYFITSSKGHVVIKKYSDKDSYKQGDKTKKIAIPDLVLLDLSRKEIINIEGKKYKNKRSGIKELAAYDDIEKLYIKKYYPNYKITRTVVLYGSKENTIIEAEICFLLNGEGELVLGARAPKLIKDALNHLIVFWK